MSSQGRRSSGLLAVLGLLAGTAALLGLAPSAGAATKPPTVTIHVGSSAPGTVVVPRGDTVTFVNDDALFAHTLTATTKNWAFTQSVARGGSYTYGKALTTDGTYSFAGSGGFDAMNASLAGNARVGAAPVASPSPKPSSASPAPSSSPTRPPSAPGSTASPAPAAPAPSATATPGLVIGSGQANGPHLDPLTGEIVPFSGQPSSGVQQPSVAGALPSAAADPQAGPAASPAPGAASYASSNRGVIGSSPHKYGLPTLVAFVAIIGVTSLIVRVLLAEPLPPRP